MQGHALEGLKKACIRENFGPVYHFGCIIPDIDDHAAEHSTDAGNEQIVGFYEFLEDAGVVKEEGASAKENV